MKNRLRDLEEGADTILWLLLTEENIKSGGFYFDRKISGGSIIKFGDIDLLENNVLIINFDKYGIVAQKEFYTKEDMKKIKYSNMETKNPVSKQSFVSSFLQSVRQKMYGKRKF